MQREQFQNWFINPVMELVKNHENGFATLLLTCSLIEAYARLKTSSTATSLNDTDYAEMEKMMGLTERDLLKAFWRAFRHGISHRGTLQAGGTDSGAEIQSFIQHNTGRSPAVWWHSGSSGKEVGVDPEALATKVSAVWLADGDAIRSFSPAIIRPL